MTNTSLVAKGALVPRLQRRTACKIKNGRQGALKWLTGSGKMSNPRFLGILNNFHYKFFDPSTPSMRKGRDGGNRKKKEKTDDYSGHYAIASS